MAMAAGAALLRSVSTKMTRAPTRLPSALEHHGRLPTSSGGRSRFSTSSGSTPSSSNPRGPQSHNKEVPSGSGSGSGTQWHRAIVAFNEAVSAATFFLLGGFAVMHFSANQVLDRMQANVDTQYQSLVTLNEEIKKDRERTRESYKESQIEATDV